MAIFLAMIFAAVLSSALTLWLARWWLMNRGRLRGRAK